MSVFKDLSGRRFGKWVVKGYAGQSNSGKLWNCVCDCGTKKVVIGDTLKKGLSKSCGCAGKDWCRTHGMVRTPTYNAWAGMLQRCENPKYRQYHLYGGRGISVCARWHKFEAFFADMGEKPENATLDRRNNEKGYSPNNCRWATQTQQIRNRGVTACLKYEGVLRPMAEWAELYGIKRKVLEYRIQRGWSTKDALTKPKSGRWGVLKK